MKESEAVKEIRFNMSTRGLSNEAAKRVVEARDMAINALKKQEKIKEAFEKWRTKSGGYIYADDDATELIRTLNQILRSDEAIEIVKQGGVGKVVE